MRPTLRPGRRALKANSSPVQKLKREPERPKVIVPSVTIASSTRMVSGSPPPGRSDISKAEPTRRPEAKSIAVSKRNDEVVGQEKAGAGCDAPARGMR